eukprot:8222-Amphidinium_carterae.1
MDGSLRLITSEGPRQQWLDAAVFRIQAALSVLYDGTQRDGVGALVLHYFDLQLLDDPQIVQG